MQIIQGEFYDFLLQFTPLMLLLFSFTSDLILVIRLFVSPVFFKGMLAMFGAVSASEN